MLGVIICPRCTLVQGADLSKARITCPRCGDKIDVKKAKVYFYAESPLELAEGVRKVGAEMFYDIETLARDAPMPPVPVGRIGIPTDEQSMRTLAMDMTKESKDFTRDDLKKELRIEDDQVIDRLLAKMLGVGIIFESSPGCYRPV
jgi:hypothetical protein